MVNWSKSADVRLSQALRALELYVCCFGSARRVPGNYLWAGGAGLHVAGRLLGGLLHGHVPVHVPFSDRLHADGAVTRQRWRLQQLCSTRTAGILQSAGRRVWLVVSDRLYGFANDRL